MLKQDNPGFLAEEIANLKALCADSGHETTC